MFFGREAVFVPVFFILLTLFQPGTNYQKCYSPQYLQAGSPGIVECSFNRTLYALVWYNQEGYENNKALVRIINGLKGGPGYSSGEYDIATNGSLVINNVTLQHDNNFTALAFTSQHDEPIPTVVKVCVIVKPLIPHPVIKQCQKENHFCFLELNKTSVIECVVKDARPAVSLNFVTRTVRGDKDVISQILVTEDSSKYTSRVSTSSVFNNSTILTYLVCKAKSSKGILKEEEAFVLIENVQFNLPKVTFITKFVERMSQAQLSCPQSKDYLFVWKKLSKHEGVFEILAYGVLFEMNISKTTSEEIQLLRDGSLVVEYFDVKHEGIYLCMIENDFISKTALYNVTVYVPALPVVHGCIQHHYCVLEAHNGGSLTCSVTGIRPVVQLKWIIVSDLNSSTVSFTDQKVTISKEGNLYNIIMTSKFFIHERKGNKLSLECRIFAENFKVLQSAAKFDLLISGGEPTDVSSPPAVHTFVLIVLVLISTVLLALLVLYKILKGRQRKTRADKEGEDEGEDIPMFMPSSSEKKSIFIEQLKLKYEDLYSAVEPIPYIKDRMYSVESVFVEVGLEKVISKGVTECLDTRHSVFTKPSVKSSRRILEGEPGYGKSTLMLQYAFDWCNSALESPLKDVEILILLRLRQLGGVSSIYKAIKQFILPRDTVLTINDIRTILSQSKSTVVILDGYDEYPDRDDESSNINFIIKRQMFQKLEVILTTRSSCLPKVYSPVTKRVKVTGFDDKARETYVLKAIRGKKEAKEADRKTYNKIRNRLQENPAIAYLCQAPLFFVMFAHMSFESDEIPRYESVTNFFQRIISCFHGHMRNKMQDENTEQFNLREEKHTLLDGIAFNSICGKTKKLVWQKEQLSKKLGTEFYDHYIRLGILIEEEIQQVNFNINSNDGHIPQAIEVRFYHKLFCEWYAAHALAEKAARLDRRKLRKLLGHLDPIEFQYLYRFACGLNQQAAKKIISFLQGVMKGEKFAILCILEQTGDICSMTTHLSQLCSKEVTLRHEDSKFLQWSTSQLLQIASRHEISISTVWLVDCCKCVDDLTSNIQLHSNVYLPALTTLKQLWIQESDKTFSLKETAGILQYSSRCTSLEVVRFYNCILPKTVTTDSLTDLRPRDVQVLWISYIGTWRLNLETGLWKDGIEDLRDDQYENVAKMTRKMLFQ